MGAVLKIRNFGPVKELDLTIGNYNILIWPLASGKSTISKVLCIIHMLDHRLKPFKNGGIEKLQPFLEYYRIANYYQWDTYWYFKDASLTFELENNNYSIQNNSTEENLYNTGSYYFPAERIALPMISDSLFELNLTESSLPKYFLKFGRDFAIARSKQKIFNLPLLDVEFEVTEGKNVVMHIISPF